MKPSVVKKRNKFLSKLLVAKKRKSLKSKKAQQLKSRIKKKELLEKQKNSEILAGGESEEERDNLDGIELMIDNEDIEYLTRSVNNKSYKLYSGIKTNGDSKPLKRKAEDEEEEQQDNQEDVKHLFDISDEIVKHDFLPIKSASGELIHRSSDVKPAVVEPIKGERVKKKKKKALKAQELKTNVNEDDDFSVQIPEIDLSQPISAAEMLAWRTEAISQYKLKIGILASTILENPENKITNIGKLVKLYKMPPAELEITLKKIVLATILEIFKDAIPSYKMTEHVKNPEQKLKKEIRQLQGYETTFLEQYKRYLMILEKEVYKLKYKLGNFKIKTKEEISLGKMAAVCLCELLKTHPHFNFRKNIIRLITPFIDCSFPSIRLCVSLCFKEIFNNDNRGDITYEIVQRLNMLVKSKKNVVLPDAVLVLANLKIEDINLNKVKEEELKAKEDAEKKKADYKISRREKKYQKRIAAAKGTLMECEVNENVDKKHKYLTEVTKLVLNIYFRVLKCNPNSGLLSATLEGLAKFTQCINIEFYFDLVKVVNQLFEEANLTVREKLNCVLCIFKIFSGQNEAINIDPNKFYTYLYSNIMLVDTDKDKVNSTKLLVECLIKAILERRRQITVKRIAAFAKRIATMSMHKQHDLALGGLSIIKTLVQVVPALNILLDVDTSVGQGTYLPEIDNPEYCNAMVSGFYELMALKKHFHPTVKQFAVSILNEVPATGKNSIPLTLTSLSHLDLVDSFDPSEMSFNPPVMQPSLAVRPVRKFDLDKLKYMHHEVNEACTKVLQESSKWRADFSQLLEEGQWTPWDQEFEVGSDDDSNDESVENKEDKKNKKRKINHNKEIDETEEANGENDS